MLVVFKGTFPNFFSPRTYPWTKQMVNIAKCLSFNIHDSGRHFIQINYYFLNNDDAITSNYIKDNALVWCVNVVNESYIQEVLFSFPSM